MTYPPVVTIIFDVEAQARNDMWLSEEVSRVEREASTTINTRKDTVRSTTGLPEIATVLLRVMPRSFSTGCVLHNSHNYQVFLP